VGDVDYLNAERLLPVLVRKAAWRTVTPGKTSADSVRARSLR